MSQPVAALAFAPDLALPRRAHAPRRLATCLAVLPGAGHYPQVERPDALAVVFHAFLETVPRHAPVS